MANKCYYLKVLDICNLLQCPWTYQIHTNFSSQFSVNSYQKYSLNCTNVISKCSIFYLLVSTTCQTFNKIKDLYFCKCSQALIIIQFPGHDMATRNLALEGLSLDITSMVYILSLQSRIAQLLICPAIKRFFFKFWTLGQRYRFFVLNCREHYSSWAIFPVKTINLEHAILEMGFMKYCYSFDQKGIRAATPIYWSKYLGLDSPSYVSFPSLLNLRVWINDKNTKIHSFKSCFVTTHSTRKKR